MEHKNDEARAAERAAKQQRRQEEETREETEALQQKNALLAAMIFAACARTKAPQTNLRPNRGHPAPRSLHLTKTLLHSNNDNGRTHQ